MAVIPELFGTVKSVSAADHHYYDWRVVLIDATHVLDALSRDTCEVMVKGPKPPYNPGDKVRAWAFSIK